MKIPKRCIKLCFLRIRRSSAFQITTGTIVCLNYHAHLNLKRSVFFLGHPSDFVIKFLCKFSKFSVIVNDKRVTNREISKAFAIFL